VGVDRAGTRTRLRACTRRLVPRGAQMAAVYFLARRPRKVKGPENPDPLSGLAAGLVPVFTQGRRLVTHLSGQRHAPHGPVMKALA